MDGKDLANYWASLVVQDPPAIQETQIQSPDQEDPLEKGMTAHSSIFAWRIPWTEEPGGLQSMGLQRVRHDCMTIPHGSLGMKNESVRCSVVSDSL